MHKDRWNELFAPLIGRILMGGYFLCNGIEQTLNFPATTVFFTTKGLPAPLLLAVLYVTIEVFTGSMLVIGYKTRPVALLLTIFILLTLFLYISADIPSDFVLTLFLQNMAIIGGLLYLSSK
jgi:putative oxidoreductase